MINSQTEMVASPRKGTLFILAASIGFGLNPLFARWAYAAGLSPEAAMLFRAIGPALIALPGIVGFQQRKQESLIALLLGMFIGLGTLTYFRSLAVVPVATAALVYFTYPLFTILLGWLFFGQRLTRLSLLTGLLVLLACVFILSPAGLAPDQLTALAISFLMPVSFATILLGLDRWLKGLKPLQVLAFSAWGQVLILLPFILLQQAPQLLPTAAIGWIAIVGLIVVSSFMPQILTIRGNVLLGAERTAIFGSAELITALIVGWVILDETVRTAELAGAGLLIAAILLRYRH